MKWNKINIKSIMNIFREIEKNDIRIAGEYAITYSDNEEEIKIIYRRKE